MKILQFLLLLLLCFLLGSCEKYLDIKRTNAQSPIRNAKDLQLLLDNVLMNSELPSDMNLSADDFYLSDDSYTSTTVSSEDRDFYIWAGTSIRSSPTTQWQRTYGIIYQANLVLEYSEKFLKEGNEDKSTLDSERGAALFYRAYGHWWIAQLYSKPYSASNAGQDLGIPLRLVSDINDKSTRGNLEQTYSRLIQDLQESVSLLPNSTPVSSRPSKAAAYAMLARVYLSMANYSQALINANLSLQIYSALIDFNTVSKTATIPFSRYNKEVIFHSTTTGSPLLEPGTTTPIAKVEPSIVTSFDLNDLRKSIFIKANTGVNSTNYRFTGNYNGTASSILFNGLAVDEVYLVRAECYARAGNINSAMSDLNTLLRTRWLSGTYVDMTAVSVEDALLKILQERRKELMFRGLRWSDLKRLNKDAQFSKVLSRTILGNTYTLPPNDLRYTLLIPSSVIQYSGIEQNQR